MKPYEPTEPMRIQARSGSEAERHTTRPGFPGAAWLMRKAIAHYA